jgi:peptidoglycan/LPS O-acetylase OafA/YrhL
LIHSLTCRDREAIAERCHSAPERQPLAGLVAVGLTRRGPGLGTHSTRLVDTVRAGATRLRAERLVPGAVRRHPVPAITTVVWAVHTLAAVGVVQVGPEFVVRFLLVFLLGSIGHLYAHRIRFDPALLVGAVVTLGISLTVFADYRSVGAPAFAYLFLWAIVALPLRWSPATDVSYGVYVYHWPVVQVLAAAGVTAAGRPAFTAVAIAATTVIALGSWHLIEGPALRQKDAAWLDAVPHRGGRRATGTCSRAASRR